MRKLPLALLSAAALTVLSACSTEAPSKSAPPTVTPITSGETQASTTDSSAPTTATTSETQCENPKKDLADTHLGAWLPSGMLPTNDKEFWYEFRVAENHFDPCAELSWVTLEGVVQQMSNFQHGAWESPTATVVFFSGEEMIPGQTPQIFGGIDDVQAEGNSATVNASEWASLVEGRKPAGQAEYSWNGTQLTSTGAKGKSGFQIDLTRAPLAGDGRLHPLGNVNHSVWDLELEPNPKQLQFIPMGDYRLRCVIGLSDVNCDKLDGPPFPMISTEKNFTPQVIMDYPGGGNNVRIEFAPPAHAVVNAMPLGNISGREDIPDEAVTKLGGVLVDTRGDAVIFSDGTNAYLLAAETVEETEPIGQVSGPDQAFINSLKPAL